MPQFLGWSVLRCDDKLTLQNVWAGIMFLSQFSCQKFFLALSPSLPLRICIIGQVHAKKLGALALYHSNG